MQRRRDDLGAILPDLFTKPEGMDTRGCKGVPINLATNFVSIETSAAGSIHQYHVGFEPEVESKRCRFEILRSPGIEQEIGKYYMFDGMILYLNNVEWRTSHVIEVAHPVSHEPVKVTFRLSKTFGRHDPQVINLYNLVVRRGMDRLGYKQLGRNYFDPTQEAQVPKYGLAVWPGFETAIRVYEHGLMLCAESRFKMLRLKNVFTMMTDEYNKFRGDVGRMHSAVEETLVGQTVVSKHNYKMYRVSRIDWDKSPLTEIRQRDGNIITLKEFYATQHGHMIGVDKQPLIVSEGKPFQPGEEPQVFYLLPELCYPTGLTDAMRNDGRVMRELSSHTRLNPDKRREYTVGLMKRLHDDPECLAMFQAWNMNFSQDLFTMRSRILPEQELVGANQRVFKAGQGAEWARHCKSSGVYRAGELSRWMLVAPKTSGDTASKFCSELRNTCNMLRIRVAEPVCVPVSDQSPNGYCQAIMSTIDQHQSAGGDDPFSMIVIILTDDNKTRYDAIKKLLCATDARSIPSQCIKQQTLAGQGGINKNFGSIVLKIALQMNCKLGGALWNVKIPLKNTMIIGYDLYHDSTNRGKTIGACVATINSDFTDFYSQTRPHADPTELGGNLEVFIRKALRKYYEKNGGLPDKVLIYRDGAGDGQIPFIKNHEIGLVKRAFEFVCGKAAPNHTIQFSFTIVTKKVNMRMFGKLPTGALTNPPPGTVVDDGVTRPERWDFYLVPQAVNQGTVSPVCYNIIEDTTGLTPDQHQLLAFKLCHMYYNWQGTVRVPAPCQYAHKLAFLVAQSLHEDAREPLKDKLYFL